jgi:hypothetical protein
MIKPSRAARFPVIACSENEFPSSADWESRFAAEQGFAGKALEGQRK